MSRAQECPCRHCTAETGRGPGCHSEDCPHGWADWNRAHIAERERRRAEITTEQAVTAICVGGVRKAKRERRKGSKK